MFIERALVPQAPTFSWWPPELLKVWTRDLDRLPQRLFLAPGRTALRPVRGFPLVFPLDVEKRVIRGGRNYWITVCMAATKAIHPPRNTSSFRSAI